MKIVLDYDSYNKNVKKKKTKSRTIDLSEHPFVVGVRVTSAERDYAIRLAHRPCAKYLTQLQRGSCSAWA